MKANNTVAKVGVAVIIAVAIFPLRTHAQRETIPVAVANGAVGSVSAGPSGPTPTVSYLLGTTDVLVTGIVGEPRSYLSDDERDVYTDYPIRSPVFLYQARAASSATPGVLPTITVTQRGGTVMVNGTKFTQKETALPPLQTGT